MAKIALLIGISEYEEGLTRLPKAVNDVEAMKRVLLNPEMGGFAQRDVTVLKNPQRKDMAYAIEDLYTNCQKDDLVLFYFSGHGVTVGNGDFYLSTRSTEKNQGKLRTASAVAARDVHSWMNQSKSKRLVVILDCCFSGAFAKGLTAKDNGTIDLQHYLGGEGRAILTASTSTQYAFESDGLDLSIYTHYLVEGIEKGAADKDGDGQIAVEELHDYAKSKVQEVSPSMTPELYSMNKGEPIFLAKSPKDDPKLKYRKEVEKIALENEGEIFPVDRIDFGVLRKDLGLTLDEANGIEFEVLEPYRKRQEKLQTYEQALSQIIQYPLSQRERKSLKRLQNRLNLRDEDIKPIEQRVLAPKEAEYNCQQQEEKTKYQTQQAEKLRQQQKQQAELQKQRERESSKPPSPPGIQTQPFEFDTATSITLTSKGFLGMLGTRKGYDINRRRGRAEYFRENLGNGVVLDMVKISGGIFLMGSPENEPERRESESPQHSVTIQDFFMGKFTVTQAQWAAVADFDKVKIDLDPDPSHFKGANRPVECVSWNDAVEFCARISQKTGKTYRLPSEAEWEYACRAGTTTPFYFGDTITTDLANYNGDYTYGSAPKGEYRKQTTDVGIFSANPFGLFDMCGNVWEWCQDDWHRNYNNAPADVISWFNIHEGRVLRGGAWFYNPKTCRSACRNHDDRSGFNYAFGFRVVCTLGRIIQ